MFIFFAIGGVERIVKKRIIKKIKYGIKEVSVKDRKILHRCEDMIYCCAAQQNFDSWPKLLLKLACEDAFGVDFKIFLLVKKA